LKGQTVDNPYLVVEKNAAETVATVEGEPGDALRFAPRSTTSPTIFCPIRTTAPSIGKLYLSSF